MDTATMHEMVIIGAITLVAMKLVGRPQSKGLIEPLPSRLDKELKKILEPTEQVHVQLVGAFQQALVCTEMRVILLKGGWMTGQLIGCNIFQLRYRAVMGAELKFQALTGYFEISSGGMQNLPRSFMSNNESRSAAKAPNCISIYRTQTQRFREACNFIMTRVEQQFNHAPVPAAPAIDPLMQINRLAELKQSGALTDQEFDAKKAELLARV